jgi:hypothetical protein
MSHGRRPEIRELGSRDRPDLIKGGLEFGLPGPVEPVT